MNQLLDCGKYSLNNILFGCFFGALFTRNSQYFSNGMDGALFIGIVCTFISIASLIDYYVSKSITGNNFFHYPITIACGWIIMESISLNYINNAQGNGGAPLAEDPFKDLLKNLTKNSIIKSIIMRLLMK